MNAGPAMVWCPFPDRGSAETVVQTLLDERLIACANITDGLRSLFSWRGERGEADEVGVLLKTDAALLQRLLPRLEALHPYQSPAIMAWRCEASPQTAAWLAELAQ